MNLVELQRRMSADVMRPLTPDSGMQLQTEDGCSVGAIASTYIKPNAALSSFERLEIYNQQYWFRVIGAVSEDFPALRAVVGEKRFDALIVAYLKANPSTSFTLRDLSGKLPMWLNAHPELAGPRVALAVDVARLEWAYVEAFDAAMEASLTENELTQLSPDMTLGLQPHLQLLALRYAVDEIVVAVRKETPKGEVASNALSHHKSPGRIRLPGIRRSPVFLVVHRFDDAVYYRRVEQEYFDILTAIRSGDSVCESIEKAFQTSDMTAEEQATRVRDYFAHAAELGWLTGTSKGQNQHNRLMPVGRCEGRPPL